MTDGATPSPKVQQRIVQRARKGDLPAVLVLPSARRGDDDLYSEFELSSVKLAAEEGVQAEYLDRVEDRRYLGEHSASQYVIQFALAVGTNLTADGLIAVGRYVHAVLRNAVKLRLVPSANASTLEISVQQVDVTQDRIHMEGVRVVASGDKAVEQLLPRLGEAAAVQEALAALDPPTAD